MHVLTSTRRRLLDLEQVQRERRALSLQDDFAALLQAASDRERAITTVLAYQLDSGPVGADIDDLEAIVQYLRTRSVPPAYRGVLRRARASIARAEAGQADPLFVDLWRWLGVDHEPGHGRNGCGLTW